MLVQKSTGVDLYGVGQDDLAMYEKCHQGQYPEAPDPMALSFREAQHRMQLSSRQLKKPREPIESFPNYVAIVEDPFTGKIVLRSSSTMKDLRHHILGGEATSKFQECIRASRGGNASDVKEERGSKSITVSTETDPLGNGNQPSHRPSKKRKGSGNMDVSDSSEHSHKEASTWKQDEDLEDDDSRYVAYRADAKDEWEKWFSDAFRAVQQVSCRVIAKEWIKTIHPKKQSTHPYNGKNPRTGERGDSNSTRPPYWPKNVIHKEPDHINKEARTKLLVHLLMNTPHREMSASGDSRSAREITAENLQESLEQKKLERDMDQLRKKSPIIEQIIEVRKSLEQFEDGGINGSTMITALNYSDFNRGCKKEEDDDEQDELVEAEGADQDGVDREFMDVGGEELHTKTTNTNSGSRLGQQDIYSDKETKTKRSGRKMSRNDELRSATGPAARGEHRTRMLPIQHPDLNIHPPLVLPDWDTQQPSPAMARASYPTQHNVSPHGMHDPFSPVNWATPATMHPGLELNSQFTDQVMITPPPMPNVMPQASYMDMSLAHGSQQPFPGVPHHSQFSRPVGYPPNLHDPRHASLHPSTPYEAFMGQPMQNQDMLQQRQYFM